MRDQSEYQYEGRNQGSRRYSQGQEAIGQTDTGKTGEPGTQPDNNKSMSAFSERAKAKAA